jgi:hypothetical protein
MEPWLFSYETFVNMVKDIVFKKKKKFKFGTNGKFEFEDDDSWETSSLRNNTEVLDWLNWHHSPRKTKKPPLTKSVSDYLKLLSVDGLDLADKRYVRDYVKSQLCEQTWEIGDNDIDFQHLFRIKNLKDPSDDFDAVTKNFLMNAIKQRMNSFIPVMNSNLLFSHGSNSLLLPSPCMKFFSSGIVFSGTIEISEISLTTTKVLEENTIHVLKMYTTSLETSDSIPDSRIIFSKPGTSTFATKIFSDSGHDTNEKRFISNEIVYFIMESFIENKISIFDGEATLTLRILS